MRCLLVLALVVCVSWCGPIPVQADEESDKQAVLASWQEWSDSFSTLRIRGRIRSRNQLRERFPETSSLSDEEFDRVFYREHELIQSTSGDFRIENREVFNSEVQNATLRGRNQREGFACQYTPIANGDLKLATVSIISIEQAGFRVDFFWDDGPAGGSGNWLQRQILDSPSSLRVKQPDGLGPANCVRAEVIAEIKDVGQLVYDLWLDRANQHFPIRIESRLVDSPPAASNRYEVTDLARHPVSQTAYPRRGVNTRDVDNSHTYHWEILEFDTNFEVVDQFQPPKPEVGTIVYDRDGTTIGDGVLKAAERQAVIAEAKAAVGAVGRVTEPIQATPNASMAWWPIAAAVTAAIIAGLVLQKLRA